VERRQRQMCVGDRAEHDRQFRGLAGAFGRFSADFTEAQEDGVITSEERATLQEDLLHLQAKATAMDGELRGGRPEVPGPPRPPGEFTMISISLTPVP